MKATEMIRPVFLLLRSSIDRSIQQKTSRRKPSFFGGLFFYAFFDNMVQVEAMLRTIFPYPLSFVIPAI